MENNVKIKTEKTRELWVKWPFFEGLIKTAVKILHKMIGQGGTLALSALATAITGVIQMIGGLFGALLKGEKILAPAGKIWGSVIFGVSAAMMTVLSVYTFTIPGADAGITTFFIMLSIIPGAFIDKIFFKERISYRQTAGIALFIFTGVVFLIDLNKPNLFIGAASWIWPSLGIALLLALNEGITRKISDKMPPFANNFWIGLTTLVVSGLGFLFLGKVADIRFMPLNFWLGISGAGVLVIFMITCKLLSYKAGGNIAVKQLVMNGTYLVTVNFTGWLIYGETWTIGKTLGLPLFFAAYLVAHQESWEYVKRKLKFGT